MNNETKPVPAEVKAGESVIVPPSSTTDKVTAPVGNSTPPVESAQKKKKSSLLPIFLVFLLLVIACCACPFAVLSYYGLTPITSSLMGTNAPRDLNVTYTQQDQKSGENKVETIDKQLNGLAPKTPVTLTEEEISAMLASAGTGSEPFTNTQVKISKNGNISISGIIDLKKVKDESTNNNPSTLEGIQLLNKLTAFTGDKIPFLAEMLVTPGTTPTMTFSKIEIARFPLPADILSSINQGIVDSLNDRSTGENAFASLEIVSIEDGKITVVAK